MEDNAASDDKPGALSGHDIELLQPSPLVLQGCIGIFYHNSGCRQSLVVISHSRTIASSVWVWLQEVKFKAIGTIT